MELATRHERFTILFVKIQSRRVSWSVIVQELQRIDKLRHQVCRLCRRRPNRISDRQSNSMDWQFLLHLTMCRGGNRMPLYSWISGLYWRRMTRTTAIIAVSPCKSGCFWTYTTCRWQGRSRCWTRCFCYHKRCCWSCCIQTGWRRCCHRSGRCISYWKTTLQLFLQSLSNSWQWCCAGTDNRRLQWVPHSSFRSYL